MKAPPPLKVLIIEDMLTIRLLLGGLIKTVLRSERPVILEAEDGIAGLAKARAEKPDIVVTDIAMPKMDGLELCRTLKNDPSFKDTAVVMMTANHTHRDEGLAVGAVAFLQKPIRSEEIEQAMRTALAAVSTGRAAAAQR